jgi:hypothetical protein
MSNQDQSPSGEALSGTIIGPLESAWAIWVSGHNTSGLDPDQLKAMRYAFYCGAIDTYNMIVMSMRHDQSLRSTVILTEAMRIDINNMISELNGHRTLN